MMERLRRFVVEDATFMRKVGYSVSTKWASLLAVQN